MITICYNDKFKRKQVYLDLFNHGIATSILVNFHFTLLRRIWKPIILLKIQSVYVKDCSRVCHKWWTDVQLVGTSGARAHAIPVITYCNYHSCESTTVNSVKLRKGGSENWVKVVAPTCPEFWKYLLSVPR